MGRTGTGEGEAGHCHTAGSPPGARLVRTPLLEAGQGLSGVLAPLATSKDAAWRRRCPTRCDQVFADGGPSQVPTTQGTAPGWGRLLCPSRALTPWAPDRMARHPTSQASSLKPTLLCTDDRDAATSVCVSGGGAGAALLREESICQASLVPESRALPPPRATAGCAGRSTAPCQSGDIWDSHRRRKQPPPRRLQHSPGWEERLPAGGPKPLPRPLHSIYNHHRFLKIPNIKK